MIITQLERWLKTPIQPSDSQSMADGQRSTAHLTELQNLFTLVIGEKADNHKSG
jgi:hypothetical protein